MGLLPKAVLHLPGPRRLADLCPAVGSSLAPRQPQGFGQWPLVSEVPHQRQPTDQNCPSSSGSASGHFLG